MDHLQQIEKIKADPGYPPRWPRGRRFTRPPNDRLFSEGRIATAERTKRDFVIAHDMVNRLSTSNEERGILGAFRAWSREVARL